MPPTFNTASTLLPHASITVATSTSTTPPPLESGISSSSQIGTQTTQNIVFGVFAVTLAFAAVVIGWLQLRSYKHRKDEPDTLVDGRSFELVEN